MSVAVVTPTSPRAPTPEYLDPILHQPTLNSLSNEDPSSSSSNPLNEFAQQVLGSESEDAHNLLDLRGGYSIIGEEQTFNDLLQNEERREAQNKLQSQQDMENSGDNDDDDNNHNHDHDLHNALIDNDDSIHIDGDGDEPTSSSNNNGNTRPQYRLPTLETTEEIRIDENGNEIRETTLHRVNLLYGGRIGKRKRLGTTTGNSIGGGTAGEEITTDADGNPVEPHEIVRLKKDSHKEVERRRRENINDGINEIAQLIPGGTDKQGKSALLKRAAQYLVELSEKVRVGDEEITKRDIEKQDLEAQLAQSQLQLQEERERSMTFETSWREAEDRTASSNFELERLKAELEELRGVQG
ncbi:uncharacterized protein IL334_004907 [Kwoniella shivajii]|uniref:BHLH domain-containing protein n=1 Tax=Kwoniella shivajii TaxID=564305 RepID=A0ABZ1D283_9TREE|nr:hypothetical protein IL334_004907 [Kwoniella shivajii]